MVLAVTVNTRMLGDAPWLSTSQGKSLVIVSVIITLNAGWRFKMCPRPSLIAGGSDAELLKLLQDARQHIDKAQKWCAYWWESDDGRRLGTDGAVWHFGGHGTALSEAAFAILAKYSGINPMWKDQERITYLVTHKEVMTMFDNAIEELIRK